MGEFRRESSATRSFIMSCVKTKDTTPELQVRKFLHFHGYRYRLHDKLLPGSPDIVLKRHQTVIFVHGCFWHRHNCRKATTPKSNYLFWQKKFQTNVARDRKNIAALKKLGWKVIVIWECQLHEIRAEQTLAKLLKIL